MNLFSFLRWWRAPPPTSRQPAAPETAAASRAPDAADAASGAVLRAQHGASTAELWRDAFGVSGDTQPVPAGHTGVVDASRASLAAWQCARRWCPGDRQTAQLLALMTALGPLVVYRVVQDQYRLLPGQPPAASVFLQLLAEQAEPMARRIAEMWQSSARMLAALDSAFDADAQRSAEESVARLGDSVLAGELLANLSLLLDHQLLTEGDCRSRALQAGVPDDLFTAVWERLRRAA